MKKIRNVVLGIIAVFGLLGFAYMGEATAPTVKSKILGAGESLELQAYLISDETAYSQFDIKVRTLSQGPESFAIDIIDPFWSTADGPKSSYYFAMYKDLALGVGNSPGRRFVTFRLTNLSAAPVEYIMGLQTAVTNRNGTPINWLDYGYNPVDYYLKGLTV